MISVLLCLGLTLMKATAVLKAALWKATKATSGQQHWGHQNPPNHPDNKLGANLFPQQSFEMIRAQEGSLMALLWESGWAIPRFLPHRRGEIRNMASSYKIWDNLLRRKQILSTPAPRSCATILPPETLSHSPQGLCTCCPRLNSSFLPSRSCEFPLVRQDSAQVSLPPGSPLGPFGVLDAPVPHHHLVHITS